MTSDGENPRKRRAEASPTGSASSKLSQSASRAKEGLKNGAQRTLSFLRKSLSRSRSRSPPIVSSRRSRRSSDTHDHLAPSLRSTSSGASSFFFTGTEPHDPEDNDSDSPRRSTAGPSHTVVDSDSESNVEILPPDDNADASPQEEPVRGRRGKPSPVQKRGGARRSSPKDKGKSKKRTPSSSPEPLRCRSGRASKPTEKVSEQERSAPSTSKTSRKKSPARSSNQRPKKKPKTTASASVDISSVPKVANIADDVSDTEMSSKKKAPARNSPMYGFFKPECKIKHKDTERGKHVPHEMFQCCLCDSWVGRNMTTQDKSSTSALRVHAEACYGHEAVKAAKETNNLQHPPSICDDRRRMDSYRELVRGSWSFQRCDNILFPR
ncbi:hypothetical protein CPB85DRAFT_1254599 [Mucidula mucida]|nr:hypothetical protein CPB85DRAFT_1254599 [Mucidula mucida]